MWLFKAIASVSCLALLGAGAVGANCINVGQTYSYCTDASGNSYNIHKIGNTTIMNGSNPNTGSNWNQTTNRIGNTSITNGRASNGNTWNSTTQRNGSNTYQYGIDSNGNPWSNLTVPQYTNPYQYLYGN